MGSHSLLQEIFPTQGSDLDLLHCMQIIYHLSHQGSPYSKLKTHRDWTWGDKKHISCKRKWQESRDRNIHSDKIDFKTKSTKKAQVGRYIMIKGSVGDITLVCMPACLCLVAQSCLTHCNLMNCSPPGSSVHGIFFRKEYWSGLPFPLPGNLPNLRIELESPVSPELQVDSLTAPQGSPLICIYTCNREAPKHIKLILTDKREKLTIIQ